MIFSTHRLTSVVDMDEIIVVAGGRVVERGSHDQLLADGGHYAKLWEDQQHRSHEPYEGEGEDDDDEDDEDE
jgi:ATP-binding cassette subfamily B protein